jgi:GntR family transcriptional regulator
MTLFGAVAATVFTMQDDGIGVTKMTKTTPQPAAKRPANRRHAVPDGYRDGSGRRVYDLLRMRIRLGEVAPDELFVETVLIRSLSATRSAVRRALQSLAEEGLLDRSPRSGTRLRGHIANAPLLNEMRPRLADGGATDTSTERLVRRLVHRGIATPTEAVASRLQLAPGARVVAVEQILYINSEPVGVRSAYFSPEPDAERVLEYFASDYYPLPRTEFFEKFYGVPAGRSEFTIEAVPSLPGDRDILGVAPGAPLLMRTVRSLDASGRPRWLSFTHLRGDRVALCG